MPQKPKYAVGQIVIVRPDLDVEKLRRVGPSFAEEMDCYLGLKAMIKDVDYNNWCEEYQYNLWRYTFSEDWLMPEIVNDVTIVEYE